MATYDGSVSVNVGSYTLRLTVNETSSEPANNRSKVDYELKIIRNSGSAANFDPNSYWAVKIDGNVIASGAFTYNFGSYSELVLVSSTSGYLNHNDDGSRTIAIVGDISGPGPITGGAAGGNYSLTDYSRPPLAPASCTVSVSGRNATVTSGIADVTDRPAIIRYEVERTNNDGVTWSGTVNTMNASRQYTYSNLDGGENYKFRTRAVNSEGNGAWRESASTFIPAGGRRWTGSSWTPTATAKRWNGSSWVDISVAKRWNGSTWVDLS